MEHGSSKRRYKGLQLIPAPVDGYWVKLFTRGFSNIWLTVWEASHTGSDVFTAEEQLFNGTQSLQSPLVDTLGVTFLLYHIIIIPTYNKRGVGSKLFFFCFFLMRKEKSAVNYVRLE